MRPLEFRRQLRPTPDFSWTKECSKNKVKDKSVKCTELQAPSGDRRKLSQTESWAPLGEMLLSHTEGQRLAAARCLVLNWRIIERQSAVPYRIEGTIATDSLCQLYTVRYRRGKTIRRLYSLSHTESYGPSGETFHRSHAVKPRIVSPIWREMFTGHAFHTESWSLWREKWCHCPHLNCQFRRTVCVQWLLPLSSHALSEKRDVRYLLFHTRSVGSERLSVRSGLCKHHRTLSVKR